MTVKLKRAKCFLSFFLSFFFEKEVFYKAKKVTLISKDLQWA